MYCQREYQAALFVERNEYRAVFEAANKLLNGESLKERVFSFAGQWGIGKTWLLFHLKDTLEKQWREKAKVAFLDLSEWSGLPTPDKLAREVMAVFAQQIGAQASRVNSTEKEQVLLKDWASRLVYDVRQAALLGCTLIVLMDNVYEAWNSLPVLEQVFLEPLAVELNVLIVLAGRGNPYPWRLRELWWGKFQRLEPFDEFQVRDMLHKLGRDEAGAGEIHRLSGGYPYVVWTLSMRDATEYPMALEEALADLLPPNTNDLCDELSRLSVFRGLDEDRIKVLFDCEASEAKKILNHLLALGLVSQFDSDKRSYVLDGAIRHLFEQSLKKDRSLWQESHRKALLWYQGWARKHGEPWETEARYHFKILEEV